MTNQNRIAVILGFYNGNQFLKQQLESIFNQSTRNIDIHIFDDNSPEKPDLRNLCIPDHINVSVIVREDNIGFAENFLNGLESVSADYSHYAFCDQDDVWSTDKLQRAINLIRETATDGPALYCGRTEYVGEVITNTTGFSPLFKKPPSFENALIQSIGGGNTMVLNKTARDLIVQASSGLKVVSHDWWSYLLISACGGLVIYDSKPCLKYRQHPYNIVGANNSLFARLKRFKMLLSGGFKEWNQTNLNALAKNTHLMTKKNLLVFNELVKLRQSGLFKRLYLLKHSGIHRQTFMGNLGLIFGVLINKV